MAETRHVREIRPNVSPSATPRSSRNGATRTSGFSDTSTRNTTVAGQERRSSGESSTSSVKQSVQHALHAGPKRQLSRQKDVETVSLGFTPHSQSFTSDISSASEKPKPQSIRAPRVVRSGSLNKSPNVKSVSDDFEIKERKSSLTSSVSTKHYASSPLNQSNSDEIDRRKSLGVKHRQLPSTPSTKIRYTQTDKNSKKASSEENVTRVSKGVASVEEIELLERKPIRKIEQFAKNQPGVRSSRLVRVSSLTTDSEKRQFDRSNDRKVRPISPHETSGRKINSNSQSNKLETYKSNELTKKVEDITVYSNQRNKPYELTTKSNLKELSPGHSDLAGEGLKVKHTHFTLPSTQKHYLSPDTVPSSMLEKSKSTSRLQNQSSTETSGLGETITSGFSSQESIASYNSGRHGHDPDGALRDQDQGIDLREDTTDIKHDDNYSFESKGIDPNTRVSAKEAGNYGVSTKHVAKDYTSSSINDSFDRQTGRNIWSKKETIDHKVSSKPMKELDNHQGHFFGPTAPLNSYKGQNPHVLLPNDAKTSDTAQDYSGEPDFDELFIQSETLPLPQQNMGLSLEQINGDWGKPQRSPSIKSRRSSVGSFRSRSGSTRRSRRFLTERESKWMKWGQDRRASYRRRMENLEKPNPEVPARASTPVKKARQEGLMFVHPDLESKYISEEDINYIQRHRQQRLQTYKVIDKNKKVNYQHEHFDLNRLTASELSILSRFWEHRVFVRSRYISILLSMISTLLHIISISSGQWVSYRTVSNTSAAVHEGLWFKCQAVIRNGLIEESCDEPSYRHWQNAVIGLMIFSAVFGFVAAVLAICGVVTSPLPRKIYYFHSSGEIFFVCALSTTVALVMYPIAIAIDEAVTSHSYGSGYGLGWGGSAFFFAASFCMSLDDLVRESAQNKCCRYLCWRSRTTEGDGTQNV